MIQAHAAMPFSDRFWYDVGMPFFQTAANVGTRERIAHSTIQSFRVLPMSSMPASTLEFDRDFERGFKKHCRYIYHLIRPVFYRQLFWIDPERRGIRVAADVRGTAVLADEPFSRTIEL